jgi:hypothetical protein
MALLDARARRFDDQLREGALAGRLMLQRCTACGFVPNFPRIACPACLAELEWFEACGRGSVETFTIVRRTHHAAYEPRLPIVLALIALEEGAETISTIVGDDRLEVEIGAAVRVVRGWSVLPQFELTAMEEEAGHAAHVPEGRLAPRPERGARRRDALGRDGP